MAGATMVQQPTNNALKQLFQDLNKVMVAAIITGYDPIFSRL